MRISIAHMLLVLVSIAACACGDRSANDRRGYASAAATASEGLVGPLKDDTSENIVSWVDGAVVTDWDAEIAKRDRAIQAYLNDADPVRAGKYGFRSGQNPRLAWSWFRGNPVGFNGLPYVVFKTILDLDPDHPDPTLRHIARIWKRQAAVPAGAAPAGPGLACGGSARVLENALTSIASKGSYGQAHRHLFRWHGEHRHRRPWVQRVQDVRSGRPEWAQA